MGKAGSMQLIMLRTPREVLQRDTGWLSLFAAVCLSSMAGPRLVNSARGDRVLPPCTSQESGWSLPVTGICPMQPKKSQSQALGRRCWGHAAQKWLVLITSLEFSLLSSSLLANFTSPGFSPCFSSHSPSHGGKVSPCLCSQSRSRVRKRSRRRTAKR